MKLLNTLRLMTIPLCCIFFFLHFRHSFNMSFIQLITVAILTALPIVIMEEWIANQIFKNNSGGINLFYQLNILRVIPWLMISTSFFNFVLGIPLIYLLFSAHFLIEIIAILITNKTLTKSDNNQGQYFSLNILFFISGFSALIYQVCWQRALFRIYGVNHESITIIITIFMLGLGLGSFLGGVISARVPRLILLRAFIIIELIVALFGFFSLTLIDFIGKAIIHLGPLESGGVIFATLLIPTLCMGATMPLLAQYLYQMKQNFGDVSSKLYFINTLGSAVACFFTVDFLFVLTGLKISVIVAVIGNVFAVYLMTRFYRSAAMFNHPLSELDLQRDTKKHGDSFNLQFSAALFLSFLFGFISLSQEIIWLRLLNFSLAGLPQVFGHGLGSILLGIALGNLLINKLIQKKIMTFSQLLVCILTLSALGLYFIPPIVAYSMSKSLNAGYLFSLFCMCLCSMFLGSNFTILNSFSSSKNLQAGRQLSMIYLFNILGAVCGPLFTEYLLLEHLTLATSTVGFVYLCLISAIIIPFIFNKNNFLRNIKSSAFIGTTLVLLVFNQDHFFKKLVEKIYFKKRYTPQMELSNIVENRNGIIVSEDHSPMSDAKNMSVVSGGGAFDGQIDQDGHLADHLPIDFKRLFYIARLHPHPRRVLQIALSSGMWTRILAGYKNIEHIDAIELNPGYFKLAKNFIGYNDLVANSKVNIIIDDGRRWLLKNPDKKYDLIIFNTPHHFRQMVSHLLSKEFLQLAKKHLNPGGIYFQTVTESEDAIFTASLQFKSIYKIYNMYAGSDSPVLENPKLSAQNISQFYYMNKPLLISSDPINRAYFDSVLDSPLVDLGPTYRENRQLREVTDDNMLTEFKRYKSRLASIYNWY